MRRDFTIFKRKDKKFYYYTTYIDGKRVYKSTGKKTKAEAILFCQNKLMDGTLKTSYKTNKFGDFAEGFFDTNSLYMKEKKDINREITESSRRIKETILKNKILPFFSQRTINEISPSIIQDWLLSFKDIKPQTKAIYLSTLSLIMQEAVFRGLIQFNPCLNVKKPRGQKTERGCFTREQIKLLFDSEWSNNDIKLMCKLSTLTGLRLNEIRALKVDKIKDGYLIIDTSIENRIQKEKKPKSRKTRFVPITKELQAELLKQAENKKGYIFISKAKTNRSWTQVFIGRELKKQLKKCNIENLNLSFHSFRHFFNSQLVLSNVKSEIIRKVIGHESEEMTDNYTHIQASDLSAVREVQETLLN